uniref:Uncharacterized protein LOC111124425 n=1 Tax=Crassostrea virginica TaxID=6565 RepID=A0A8B8D5P9_CRAVI|nr:uncharacterized protein LOC111124425 [Crassostrea virginica]
MCTTDRSLHITDMQRMQKLTETELTIMIANHFLGKLATSTCYVVDKNCTRKNGDKCFCGDESCKMTGQYGDTSVGNVDVWHGNLDIVINNDLPVELLEDVPDSPGGKSDVEIKKRKNMSSSSCNPVFKIGRQLRLHRILVLVQHRE